LAEFISIRPRQEKKKAIDEGEVMEIREESVNMTAKLVKKERIKLPYQSVVPIPITEESLLEFGFSKEFENKDRGYKELEIIGSRIRFRAGFDCDKLDGFYISGRTVPVKYIHQLQNLFHDFTGEELTVKER